MKIGQNVPTGGEELKIALLGASGLLGSKTAEFFKAKGHELLTPGRSDADLSHPHTLENFFLANSFDVLVNCAGFTRVDACEEPAKFSMALNTNGTSVGWLAQFCKKANRILVHYSTDYVFDGSKDGPYEEKDRTDPLNVYGKTKRQGETLIEMENPFYYLIRSSWVFGPHGDNFVNKIAGLLKTKSRLEVVSDQVGGPTYTGDLAQFTLELLEKKAEPGLYHFANEGHVSWHGFAKEIQKQLGLNSCEIVPVLSENVFRPAQRPANSRFELAKSVRALGHPIRSWQEALREYLTKEYKSEAA
jgi:dTDP-4-dehydrorhamnose reductase